MKKQLMFIVLLTGISIFNACKKDKTETPITLDSQTKQFNDDSNNYKSESDQADNDINGQLQDIPAFGRNTSASSTLSSPLCGATIDSSQIAQHILTFNFDGQTPCFSPSRTRSGAIKVELTSGNYWRDVNAVLTLTYINFKVTRLSDNKSILFNGVKTLKNLNGNDWLGFIFGTSTLKYQERAFNIQVVFDNTQHAVWNSARITEWSYTPSTVNITFTSNGDTTLNGFSHVDSWGTNRFAQSFTTYYNTSILSNTYCGLWRPNAGELVHHVNNADFTLTLGVDQNGNATPYACAYGYKVTWTNSSGASGNVVLSY